MGRLCFAHETIRVFVFNEGGKTFTVTECFPDDEEQQLAQDTGSSRTPSGSCNRKKGKQPTRPSTISEAEAEATAARPRNTSSR